MIENSFKRVASLKETTDKGSITNKGFTGKDFTWRSNSSSSKITTTGQTKQYSDKTDESPTGEYLSLLAISDCTANAFGYFPVLKKHSLSGFF